MCCGSTSSNRTVRLRRFTTGLKAGALRRNRGAVRRRMSNSAPAFGTKS